LSLTVTGTPAATGITWTRLRNNQLTTLDIVNSNGKYTGGTTSNPHLTISNFQSSDAGTYVHTLFLCYVYIVLFNTGVSELVIVV
jgi:hypothetical protein